MTFLCISGFRSGPRANPIEDPAVILTIFDGRYLRDHLRKSEIKDDAAIYHYNQLFMNATQKVLDGIMLLKNAEIQRVSGLQKTIHSILGLLKALGGGYHVCE